MQIVSELTILFKWICSKNVNMLWQLLHLF